MNILKAENRTKYQSKHNLTKNTNESAKSASAFSYVSLTKSITGAEKTKNNLDKELSSKKISFMRRDRERLLHNHKNPDPRRS